MLTLQDVEIRDMKKFVEALKGTFSGKIQVKRKTIITGFTVEYLVSCMKTLNLIKQPD